MNKFLNLQYQQTKLLHEIDNLEHDHKKKIRDALKLAQEAHKGQKRDEGQEFIIHPIRIANCLIDELSIKNPDIIISGLLHDVVEDSNVTVSQIKKKFGNKVGNIVKTVTRDPNKESKLQKFKKLMQENHEIRLIKAIDRLDNIRCYLYRTDRGERFKRHLREIFEMNLPLAKSVNKYILKEMEKIIEKLRFNEKNNN